MAEKSCKVCGVKSGLVTLEGHGTWLRVELTVCKKHREWGERRIRALITPRRWRVEAKA